MRQVGWYDSQTCTFFNGDKDDGCHGTYSEPVFVDDIDARTMVDEIPMPKCKEPRIDDIIVNDVVKKNCKLWHEIQLQILENQICQQSVTLKYETLTGATRISVENMRRHSIELLEKGKKAL